ncbi:hypothetical protein MUK42_06914 [Musa troglodytarum]|uniref:Uncharacterized protein n=1 Tax=Musa troglodytarum TaxID=320322 RepID=A0A9E7HB11_9LILI|nr:hypothetical protein MUK42_06914 [Musa troglodytarum]URE26864.1 hypothetical protein MUK42_06914 [Musa troglodytarum]URE26867.1 hypothetical protein MUK42_06914 [Musa troglodytarum]
MQLGLAQQRGSEEPLVPSPTQTECAVTGRRLLRPATARLERVFLHCRSPVPRRKEDGNEEVEEDGSGSDVLCHDLGRLPFLAVNGQGRRLDRSPPRRKGVPFPPLPGSIRDRVVVPMNCAQDLQNSFAATQPKSHFGV